MSKTTVQITDPSTLRLLAKYKRFLQQQDGITEVTLAEMVEGLVVGCLDEHSRFRQWRREQNGTAAAEPAPAVETETASNVTRLPINHVRPVALAASSGATSRRRAL